MESNQDTANFQAPAHEYLDGPFSPFAVALHNIKDNLISKYDAISEESIQNEILKEIITLNIRLPSSQEPPNQPTKRYIEFPVAACWPFSPQKQSGTNEWRYFYSGEFPDIELERMPDEIKKIKANVRRGLQQIHANGLSHGPFEFDGAKTEYPESLRQVRGFWRVDVAPYFTFITLYNYFPSNSAIPQGELETIWKDLKKFFEIGCAHFSSLISIKNASEITVINEPHRRSAFLTTDVPILEEIVSRVQNEIGRIKIHSVDRDRRVTTNDAQESQEFKDAFSVVFVRPGFNREGRLCFRYILTNKQLNYLRNKKPSDIMNLVHLKKHQVLSKLSNDFATLVRFKGAIGSVKELSEAVREFADLSKQDGRIDELLRSSIVSYYAFHKNTIKSFEDALVGEGADDQRRSDIEESPEDALRLADSIESTENWVSAQQAFLITQILRSDRSDVVSDFINHPFSKYLQHPTQELFKLFKADFQGAPFYPRVLHLFEMLFFPERFFMYPISHFEGVPLLLCAFDADYYLQSRANLRGILAKYNPAIFSAILTFQLGATNKMLADIPGRGPSEQPTSPFGAEEWYVQILKLRLKHLLRLFCVDMTSPESLSMKEARREAFAEFNGSSDRALVRGNRIAVTIDVAEEQKTYVMQLEDNEDAPDFIVESNDGRHILKRYLEQYAELFCLGSRHMSLLRKLERHKLSAVVAHAVKTGLSPLSELSKSHGDKTGKLEQLLVDIKYYQEKQPTLPFGQAYLDTHEIPGGKFNSISNVLSFYAQDAEKKAELLYGGMQKDREPRELQRKVNIENYVVGGLIRGYCIALIRGVDSFHLDPQGRERPKLIEFELDGIVYLLRIPDVENTLEVAMSYQSEKPPDAIQIPLKALRLDAVAEANYGIRIATRRQLPEWESMLLLIVAEELMLNAVSSKKLRGRIVVHCNDDCLLAIENSSEARITDRVELKKNISTGIMGGLHTAYFVVEDENYLNMRFDTACEPDLANPGFFRNVARISETAHG